MEIYILLFGICFGTGVFFLSAQLMRLPTIASQKALINMGNRSVKKASSFDVIVVNLTTKLSEVLTLNEFAEMRLQGTLRAAGINQTPSFYTANAIVKGGLIAVGGLPCLLILPLLTPFFVIFGVVVFFKEKGQAECVIKIKRDIVEKELPRFVANLTQELKNSRDIISILERYKPSAEKTFADELDILTADMRSGSYETALTRFESRLNSPLLSDIIRGLISVIRGDDAVVYFEMVAHDMKQMELQKLKQEAQKIPEKIRKYSFLMLMCFTGTYMVVLIYQLILSMTTLF